MMFAYNDDDDDDDDDSNTNNSRGGGDKRYRPTIFYFVYKLFLVTLTIVYYHI